MKTENTIGKPAWHVHHERLCEFLTEPIERRIEFIKKHEPPEEIEIWLRLLKLVKGPTPKKWQEASANFRKAEAEWQKAHANWSEAYPEPKKVRDKKKKVRAERKESYAKREEVHEEIKPFMEKLHAKECPDCPWNGQTIFPGKH